VLTGQHSTDEASAVQAAEAIRASLTSA
jgi:hypothetical protein